MIVKSKLTVATPQEPMHTTVLRKCLEFHKDDPERAAFFSTSDKTNAVTFKQVYDYSLNLASWLMENDFKKGDVVLISLRNSWHFPVACLGAWSADELRYQLEDSTAKLIITEELLLSKMKKANGTGARIICVSEQKHANVDDFVAIVTRHRPVPVMPVYIDLAEDLMFLAYSSGTTGAPKGVMLTHGNFAYSFRGHIRKYAEIYSAQGVDGYVPPLHSIAFLPFYHAMGLFNVFFTLYNGTTQITMARFNLKELLQHIQDYHISLLLVVPSVILAMVESPLLDSYDLSSLALVGSGAAPLSQSVVDRLQQRLPEVRVVQGYGMTETSVASHIPTFSCPKGSVGTLLPNTEMKIVSCGKLCGPFERGELWIRGPQIMKGYWRRPELTKEMFDSEGFMRTGDIAYYDKDGYTFICDRDKELIKVNGKQVSPTEIEEVLIAHPKITDCCVIGIPDEKRGEVPLAFVVAKSINEDSIHAYVKERLAPYKRLRGGIKFVDVIPRTPTGKTLKRKLKDEYLKTVKPSQRSHI
ncbi:AMP-binding enzyme [Ancylostoma ceylanicum]|uniref:AMP-binding enzyme n=1 Tax=Ancylostoma ceylanicum TaxID=53326 RepID=A0A0D6M4S9_9BILA|nr:AMP-binding enzyme [Ancylostoma ceylanicum]